MSERAVSTLVTLVLCSFAAVTASFRSRSTVNKLLGGSDSEDEDELTLRAMRMAIDESLRTPSVNVVDDDDTDDVGLALAIDQSLRVSPNSPPTDRFDVDIVIVGGGPVGLFAAWSLGKALPGHRIMVYEKRNAYTRRQVLVIQQDIVGDLPLKNRDEHTCYIYPPPLARRSRCFRTPTRSGLASIPTHALEEMLREEIHMLGNVDVVNEQADLSRVPVSAAIIIASGNAREYANTLGVTSHRFDPGSLFGAVAIVNCANLPIGAHDNAAQREQLSAPQHRHRVFTVPSMGYTYVGVTLDKAEHDELTSKLEGHQRHSPHDTTVPMTQLPEGTREKFQLAMLSHDLTEFCNMENLQEVKTFPIKLESTDPPAIIEPIASRPVFFMGDAAFSSHFFSGQGVNSGMRTAKALVDVFKSHHLQTFDDKTDAVNAYTAHVNKLRENAWMNNADIIAAQLEPST